MASTSDEIKNRRESVMASIIESHRKQKKKRCFCGLEMVVRTSTTASNKGRRFRGCPLFPRKDACNYFHWIDENKKEQSLNVNQQEWEDEIIEYRVQAIKLEMELGEVREKASSLQWDLNHAREEIIRLKEILDSEKSKKRMKGCGYCCVLMMLLCVLIFLFLLNAFM